MSDQTAWIASEGRTKIGEQGSRAPQRRVGPWLSMVLLGILGLLATGCTWVALTPQAENVGVVSAATPMTECKKVGQIKARTKSSVGIFGRSSDKIAEELINLAKNDAAEMGANRIVAQGPPSESGEQKFLAYQCPMSAR